MAREYTLAHYLEKAAAYCAYQERSEWDVRARLKKWELSDEESEKIIEQLRSDKFFDDTRFAAAFARGKFRMNKWGRYKIVQGLSSHGISHELAHQAVDSLQPAEYQDTLMIVLKRKVRKAEMDNFKEKARVFQYLTGRGFEMEYIQEAWNQFLQEGEQD